MTDKSHLRRTMTAAAIQRDFEDHITHTLAKDQYTVTQQDHYQALAYTLRDRLVERWLETQRAHHDRKAKRVYYLSLEFLMGRVLGNNILNLGDADEVHRALQTMGLDLATIEEQEADMGLGNGGLGRLAACFLDSMATMEIPAIGYGIRYHYGIFRQDIEKGRQIEHPDEWLQDGCPWEIPRPDLKFEVHFGGRLVQRKKGGTKKIVWVDTESVIGIPYDVPIVGYGGKTVNTLRLWTAHANDDFDFDYFNQGDYVAAVEHKITAENLTKVLYPNDHHTFGKELRLRQQYMFVSCSLQDIMRRFKKDSDDWDQFPALCAIQLNDTHPALAVPELMRLLIDVEGLRWDRAWQITRQSLAYTNHTLMPEALEKWPVTMLERLLPRHLRIIYDINQRFIAEVLAKYPDDEARVIRMSMIEEGREKKVRMAHLAIVGAHATNGVAQIHTDLLKVRVVPDFAHMFPQRFHAITNGITQRRWLAHANPDLAKLITATIGDAWLTDLNRLHDLTAYAEDAGFRDAFAAVKQKAKVNLAAYVQKRWNWTLDPGSIFDTQIKRIHEYKRQLMNAIHIVMVYNRLLHDPGLDYHPRTFLLAGKAAPGYFMAKLIIKLVNDIAKVVNHDPRVRDRLQVRFLPNYNVTLAEKLIPATEVSEQISTAGTEASGTGNMKFMLNGALTIGTLDGANVEMAEEVGAENMFIFGLKADQAQALAEQYDPQSYYRRHDDVRAALDLIFSGYFNRSEPQLYEPIRESLLQQGDTYMLLADLPAYRDAQQASALAYQDQPDWQRKAVLNTAAAGKFSSDRTIGEYARHIWRVKPSPMENR